LKILILTPRFPYPLEKGDKLRAYHQLRILARDHDVTLVSIIQEVPSPESIEKVLPLTQAIYLMTIRPADRAISLFSALFSGLPFQVAWFFSPTLRQRLQKLIEEIRPDHIYCQLPRMAEYCRKMPYAKTLDYMDSFGLSMMRRSTVAKWPASWIYQWEAKRMLAYERKIAADFDHLTIISEQDKRSFQFGAASEMTVVPNGIDTYFLDDEKKEDPVYDIVFVGNLSYLPNVETAEFLVNHILPLCPENTTVLISGASPQKRVLNLRSNRVWVEGWREDIRKAYRSGRVFLAPMWTGTGQQNKILEAMALGIPCITTPLVNNAIGATDGKEILLAETPASFAKAFNALLQNPEMYEDIKLAAKQFVRDTYSWEQNGTLLSFVFEKIKKNES
jgi:glycosyltransferase involved in cell wall biosynthesis